MCACNVALTHARKHAANMDAAHARDAVSNKVFFFRHSHVPASKPSLSPVGVCAVCAGRCPEEGLAQLTIDEIMNGSCCKGAAERLLIPLS